MANEHSRVLTLVFTDLADSTALKTAQGDHVVHDLIEAHRGHVTQLAEECAGRIIDWAGDGCFLSFETSSAGVMFALRLQQAHTDAPELPGVRIGIHMGEVSESPGPLGPQGPPRIDGLAVDIAARVSALAKPGQVLMSASVYQSARQRLGVDTFGQPIIWQAHGTHELKGVDEPMDIRGAGLEQPSPRQAPGTSEKVVPLAESDPGRYAMTQEEADAHATRAAEHLERNFHKVLKDGRISPTGFVRDTDRRSAAKAPSAPRWALAVIAFLLIAVGLLVSQRYRSPAPTDAPSAHTTAGDMSSITSLAVLPLENLSNDPDQAYFADGLTDTLTAELAKIGSIRVISRTSTLKYRDTTKSIPEIAKELGVDALIEGSVFLSGNEVRITAQLIDGTTDSHLWADTYTGTLENVIRLQGEVALAIAKEIGATITPEEEVRLTTAKEVNPEAYQAYLRGLNVFMEFTPAGIQESQGHFTESLALDPEFAQAHLALGSAHYLSAVYGMARPIDAYPLALSHATQAIALDDSLGDAHGLLGYVNLTYTWDWETAKRELLRGIELTPNSALTHTFYAEYLRFAGERQKALDEYRIAQQLEPDQPLNYQFEGKVHSEMGAHDKAVSAFQAALEVHPNFVGAMFGLVGVYAATGESARATALLDDLAAILGADDPMLKLRMISIKLRSGDLEGARAQMDEMGQDVRQNPAFALFWGVTYAKLGEKNQAFDLLEKGLNAKSADSMLLRFSGFKMLHDDPRYWDLIERVGFPPLPPDHPDYAEEQEWMRRKAAEAEANAPIEKIAVLPFHDMGAATGEEWFAGGMTETLVAQLAKIDGVRLISRTSAMRYKNTDESMPAIARASRPSSTAWTSRPGPPTIPWPSWSVNGHFQTSRTRPDRPKGSIVHFGG